MDTNKKKRGRNIIRRERGISYFMEKMFHFPLPFVFFVTFPCHVLTRCGERAIASAKADVQYSPVFVVIRACHGVA
jgi:hypothetical protein